MSNNDVVDKTTKHTTVNYKDDDLRGITHMGGYILSALIIPINKINHVNSSKRLKEKFGIDESKGAIYLLFGPKEEEDSSIIVGNIYVGLSERALERVIEKHNYRNNKTWIPQAAIIIISNAKNSDFESSIKYLERHIYEYCIRNGKWNVMNVVYPIGQPSIDPTTVDSLHSNHIPEMEYLMNTSTKLLTGTSIFEDGLADIVKNMRENGKYRFGVKGPDLLDNDLVHKKRGKEANKYMAEVYTEDGKNFIIVSGKCKKADCNDSREGRESIFDLQQIYARTGHLVQDKSQKYYEIAAPITDIRMKSIVTKLILARESNGGDRIIHLNSGQTLNEWNFERNKTRKINRKKIQPSVDGDPIKIENVRDTVKEENKEKSMTVEFSDFFEDDAKKTVENHIESIETESNRCVDAIPEIDMNDLEKKEVEQRKNNDEQ